jgi:hypothetical protein
MFLKRFGWLILTTIAFISGVLVTVQWIGTDHGIELYNIIKRPDVVEKVVEVEIVKVIIISDDMKIQIINQEYRDALLKISAVEYDGYSNDEKIETMHNYATKALLAPDITYKTDSK